MKVLLSILSMWFLSMGTLFATDYFTLQNGNWFDNLAVWSTDGHSPCGCHPPSGTADRISVRHQINMDVDLTVQSGGSLTVLFGASLANNQFQLTNYGEVLNQGSISVKSLKNKSGGSFVHSGYLTVVQGPTINEGSMIINGSFRMEDGIFENKDGAYFAVGENIEVVVAEDDAFNKGTIEFMGSSACMKILKKNFYNQAPSGAMEGYGGINVDGDINNHGTWENSVDWCAGGCVKGDNVLPPENCGGVCNTAFPIALANFRADIRAGFVNLSWETYSELNTDFFGVEKRYIPGEDGICTMGSCTGEGGFEQIGQVDAKGGSGVKANYYFTDKSGNPGINLYRLRVQDVNGTYVFSPVVSVSLIENQPGLLIYPNPSNTELHIRMTGSPGTKVKVEIFDITGRLIWQQTPTLSNNMEEIIFNVCDLASGTYLVNYAHKEMKETRKLVIQK